MNWCDVQRIHRRRRARRLLRVHADGESGNSGKDAALLPSLHEAGIAGYDVTSWAGLFAPAGTPKEIVARLNEEVAKIIANADAKARIAVTGFDAFTGPPETLAAFVQSGLANWAG